MVLPSSNLIVLRVAIAPMKNHHMGVLKEDLYYINEMNNITNYA